MKQNDILSYFQPLTDQAPKIGIFPAAGPASAARRSASAT